MNRMLRLRASWLQPMIAVPAAQMARRRTPGQAGDRPPLRPHQIFQMLAHRLLVAEVVMLLEEAVEQRLIAGAADLLHFHRPQFIHGAITGVVSISTGVGRARSTSGLRGGKRTSGSWISPARCSISSRPRQTMSHNAPLACFHSHASHTFADSFLRLSRSVPQ
jgi:hypothetical protein